MEVHFGAGVAFKDIMAKVHSEGFGLVNLPSWPHMNVAGSVSTGTHGSGHMLPQHGEDVTRMEIVTPKGEVLKLIKGKTPNFSSYIMNFGGIGVITSMSMRILPTYNIRKSIYKDLKWDVFFKNYDAVMESSYNLALFVDYPKRSLRQIWRGQRYEADEEPPQHEETFFGADHIPEDFFKAT
jgi:xylitol oxidase